MPVTREGLEKAWNNFAEQRKHQVAEYHLLTQPIELVGTEVVLHLSNPVEEPLLASIKNELTTYLREQLENSSVTVSGTLKELEARKVIYTNKEKFDHLAEKYPLLHELRDRLGLDPDF